MRILNDFECTECGLVFERLNDSRDTTIVCECGGVANKLISRMNFKLPGTDPGYPGAYDKWARDHERAGRNPRD